jgi:hypothetical protein
MEWGVKVLTIDLALMEGRAYNLIFAVRNIMIDSIAHKK